MKIVIALLIAVGVLLVPNSVSAQGVTRCDVGAVTQFDLSGYYASESMAVSVYPCGGSYVEWHNVYGVHSATYVTTLHLSDGVIAQGMSGALYLDGSTIIGYKAADPGYIQVFTEGPFGSRMYRLRKMY
jgi:hypothetical protein